MSKLSHKMISTLRKLQDGTPLTTSITNPTIEALEKRGLVKVDLHETNLFRIICTITDDGLSTITTGE